MEARTVENSVAREAGEAWLLDHDTRLDVTCSGIADSPALWGKARNWTSVRWRFVVGRRNVACMEVLRGFWW
jgi:hypothetical protein